MGEGEVDGHTMKTGFKNEPQGNGGKQSPRDHQTFEDLWKRGPGVSDPEKKTTKWVPEDHKDPPQRWVLVIKYAGTILNLPMILSISEHE